MKFHRKEPQGRSGASTFVCFVTFVVKRRFDLTTKVTKHTKPKPSWSGFETMTFVADNS